MKKILTDAIERPAKNAGPRVSDRHSKDQKEVIMKGDGKITLKVATPAGFYEGTFQETDKVSEVIAIIVKEQKLADGDAYELAFDGESLEPTDRPLSSFPLYDGAVLDLIASGSAV